MSKKSPAEFFKEIADLVVEGDKEAAAVVAREAIEASVSPFDFLMKGICEGLRIVSEKFSAKEFFYPDLVCAAEATMAALSVVKPHLKVEKASFTGTYVIGTVEGDLHDIGKDIVATVLEAAGFKVIDLGVDVPPSRFVEAAKKYDADIVGSSVAIGGVPRVKQKEIEDALREAGIREKIKTMVGGAFTDEKWAIEIGADAWGKDCFDALRKAEELVKKVREERKIR
jgi:methylmalonyl-CoA mutase cobalamin-binding domain/chain